MIDHVRIHLKNDVACFAVKDDFVNIANELKNDSSDFMLLRDIYDNQSILIRKSEVTAISWWTVKGSREYYKHDAELEKLKEESTGKPSWE